jgi:flagellar biosynthesis chaperone FliJ
MKAGQVCYDNFECNAMNNKNETTWHFVDSIDSLRMPPKHKVSASLPRTPEAFVSARKVSPSANSPGADLAVVSELHPTYLTLNALYLLGFRNDEYFAKDQHVRYTAALDSHTFDRTNERALLLILHFLLSRLVPQFDSLNSTSWPYTDVRSKNAFKRVVEDALQTLVDQRRLSPELSHASVLTTAKGSSAWRLLVQLTSICVAEELASRGIKSYQHIHRDESGSVVNDFDAIITAIRGDMESEASLLMQEHLAHQRVERDRRAYADELYKRYKRARSSVESLKKELQDFERSHPRAAHALSEAGKVERSAAIIDIEAITSRLFEWRDKNIPERSASKEADSPGAKALQSYLSSMQFVDFSGRVRSYHQFENINDYLNELMKAIEMFCDHIEKWNKDIEAFEEKKNAIFANLDSITLSLRSIERKLLKCDVNFV